MNWLFWGAMAVGVTYVFIQRRGEQGEMDRADEADERRKQENLERARQVEENRNKDE